jgi:uncharacterized protein (DUF1778 family)
VRGISSNVLDLWVQQAHNLVVATKTRRPAFRMTEEQERLLKRAAELSGVNFSDFVVGASMRQAQEIMADQRYFPLDEADWATFDDLVESPVSELSPGLRRLAARRSVFE